MWHERGAARKSSHRRNQGSAGSSAFGLTQGRDDAKLLHHAQSVPIAIGIHDFSVGDVVDSHSVNRYFFVGRWNSQVIAFVGAGNGPAGDYFILLGNGVLEGPVQIRVACEEKQNLALVRLRTNGRTENVGGLEGVAGGDDFTNDFKLPLVPDFFIEAPNDGLVIG